VPSPPPPPPSPARAALDEAPTPFAAKTGSKPPPAPGGKTGAVDIDWDDDDEATTVFDKIQDDPARSLLRSAPPPAAGSPAIRPSGPPAGSRMPPPPPVPSKPPPPPPAPPKSLAPPPAISRAPLPMPSMPSQGSMPSMAEPYPAQQGGGRSLWMVLAAVVILGVGAAGYFIMKGKPGSLAVAVAGPGNRPVDGVEIFVDGKKAPGCSGATCRVENLKPGAHTVRATAAGYGSTADTIVKISPGEEQVQNLVLGGATGGTGIKVTAEGRGLKLFIDDKEIGPLPQERADVSPGEHKIRIEGDRYETFEKTVTVEADNVTTVDPELKVKKGLVTIKLGENAQGAAVTLVSGDERRPIPPERFKDGALAVDLEASKPYSIVAEKKGFASYEKRIDFDDGQAEKTFVVNLMLPTAARERETETTPPRGGGGRVATPSPAPKAPPAAAAPAPAAAAGNATLTFVSDPPSNLVLDGKPLGKTPKTASVPAGSHTVLFIHPEFGRKAKSIPVAAGQKATVKVKFP
jgi:hypothetical protein